ncbi:hypothetical protein LIER_25530 [Lithospermum erythrorhizon]|uniref:Uncharacterized protein n=1 Tax=Lithospermum erythrorhizon TaxID=34254 RepID=A0AAV3R777_LITER
MLAHVTATSAMTSLVTWRSICAEREPHMFEICWNVWIPVQRVACSLGWLGLAGLCRAAWVGGLRVTGSPDARPDGTI